MKAIELPCDVCGGSGKARYPPDLELAKCRRCNGKGTLPAKKVAQHLFY